MNTRELLKQAAINSFIELAPIDWEKKVDNLTSKQRDDLRRALENVSERAAMLAGYLDERHGYGCGDQGHTKAIKRANKNGKIVWLKVFGYNCYHELNV